MDVKPSCFRFGILVITIALVNHRTQSFAFPSNRGSDRQSRLVSGISFPVPRSIFNHQKVKPTSINTKLAADFASQGAKPTVVAASKQLRKKKLQNFQRYLEVECWKRKDLRGLESVLQAVASACKQINRIVQRAQTDDVYGVALDSAGNPLSDNVQGETQQKLDVLCNTIMLQAFCGSSRQIHSIASEEEDKPRCCSDVMVRWLVDKGGHCLGLPNPSRYMCLVGRVFESSRKCMICVIIFNFVLLNLSCNVGTVVQNDSAFGVGDFFAVFDPIDGSKNIDASLPVGTIFGIYRKPSTGASVTDASFLQDGKALVAAGYCLYSYVKKIVMNIVRLALTTWPY